jgi:hypothetical protein
VVSLLVVNSSKWFDSEVLIKNKMFWEFFLTFPE